MSYPTAPARPLTTEELTQIVFDLRKVNPSFRFDDATMARIYAAANARAEARIEELGHKGRSWRGR